MTPRELSTLLENTVPKPAELAASAAVEPNNYQVWLTNLDGYVVLNWSSPTVGKYDYVALYAPGANEDAAYGYITNQWQWVSRGSSYQTGTTSGPNYVAVYWSWSFADDPNNPNQKSGWTQIKVSAPSK